MKNILTEHHVFKRVGRIWVCGGKRNAWCGGVCECVGVLYQILRAALRRPWKCGGLKQQKFIKRKLTHHLPLPPGDPWFAALPLS